MRIMILGNPNAGKTSLFNALTHEHKKVANWSGVTVYADEAPLFYAPTHQIIDLPGFYSLSAGQLTGLEMQFAAQQLLEHQPDFIINVVNGSQLERNLLLSSQLLELSIPMLMVITHLDVLAKSEQAIDLNLLSQGLGVSVFGLYNYNEDTVTKLSKMIVDSKHHHKPRLCVPWPQSLAEFNTIEPGPALFTMRRFLESGENYQKHRDLSEDLYQQFFPQAQSDTILELEKQGLDFELEMMDARYQFVHDLCVEVFPHKETKRQRMTQRLDRWMLHRYLGWPIFLSILWIFFSLAVNFGGAVQQSLTAACDMFFNQHVNHWLDKIHAFHWVKSVVVQGLGQGVSTMLSFLPVMACMNCFLSILETSGYMARVAFLFERIMRSIGLPGKAFLPLFIGFGCNVPAIMAARMIEGSKERLLTVLLSPFMSCSARLTIYAVFASLFFPQSGGWVVLSLYLLGVLMAILTGYFLRQVWLSGDAMPLMMELPLYKTPDLQQLIREVYLRLKIFIIRSGKLVVTFCMFLAALQGVLQGDGALTQWMQHTLWSFWIHGIQPVFAPMGIRIENWPAAAGLFTGTMAKEVVIATLNTFYVQLPNIPLSNTIIPHSFGFLGHLMQLPSSVNAYTSQALLWAFGDSKAAYSYLIFVLLYIPCISTLAIIRQEVGRFWQWFALIWSLMLAYSVACLFYQTATFFSHPGQTIVWFFGLFAWWCMVFYAFKYWRPMDVNSD